MAFSNDIILRAQADLQRAEKEALTARDRLARAEAEINDLRAFLRKLEHYATPNGEVERTVAKRSPRGSGGKRKIAADFCFAYIAEKQRRVEMSELFPAVLAAGIEIGGTDEKSVLAGYLSRDERLNFIRGAGWGIVKSEGAADLLGGITAPSQLEGGQDGRTTLTSVPVANDPFS